MSDVPLHISIGKVETLIGELEFTFVVNEKGEAHLQVWTRSPPTS